MKKGKRKSQVNKDEMSEDCCFVCKDGGDLYICDYKDCLKAYHANCVGKDKSFFDKGGQLTCDWHHCSGCDKKQVKHQCYCCPKAWCGGCIEYDQWAKVRGSKGFCNPCLKVLLLGENQEEEDSDGEKVDWKNRFTFECLLYDYWLEIKDKENLRLEDLQLADEIMKKYEKSVPDTSGLEKFMDESSESNSAEDSGSDSSMTLSRKGKRSKGDDKFFSDKTKSHYGSGSTNRNETLSNIQGNKVVTGLKSLYGSGSVSGDKVVTNDNTFSGKTESHYGNGSTNRNETLSNIQGTKVDTGLKSLYGSGSVSGDKVVTNDNFFSAKTQSLYGSGSTNRNETLSNIQGNKVVTGLKSLFGSGSVSANCENETTITDEALMINQGDKVVANGKLLSGSTQCSYGNETTKENESPCNIQGDKVATDDNFSLYGNETTNGNEIPSNIQASANCGIGTTKTDEVLMTNKDDDESIRNNQSTATQRFELIQPGSQVPTQATNGEKMIQTETKKPVVIDLSSGSDSDCSAEDLDAHIWNCSGPGGDISKYGPHSLSFLKKCCDSAPYASKCKAWKVGESKEKAIMLPRLLKKSYPES